MRLQRRLVAVEEDKAQVDVIAGHRHRDAAMSGCHQPVHGALGDAGKVEVHPGMVPRRRRGGPA